MPKKNTNTQDDPGQGQKQTPGQGTEQAPGAEGGPQGGETPATCVIPYAARNEVMIAGTAISSGTSASTDPNTNPSTTSAPNATTASLKASA